jgi:hypothetical protein
MNNIKIELTLKQFQSLKVVLQYVMDNELENYEEYCKLDSEFVNAFENHVYAHTLRVVEALV